MVDLLAVTMPLIAVAKAEAHLIMLIANRLEIHQKIAHLAALPAISLLEIFRVETLRLEIFLAETLPLVISRAVIFPEEILKDLEALRPLIRQIIYILLLAWSRL